MNEKQHPFGDIQHELISKDAGKLAERRTLREALTLSTRLQNLIREHHRASLQADGVDVLKANQLELEAAELASVVEWLKNAEKQVRDRYEDLINSMGEYAFAKELKADRLRNSTEMSD